MPRQITLPNGDTVTVPDTLTETEIQDVINQAMMGANAPTSTFERLKSMGMTASPSHAPATTTPPAPSDQTPKYKVRNRTTGQDEWLTAEEFKRRTEIDPGYRAGLGLDRKSTRLNSSHIPLSRMPSSA